ncbi:signal peptide peptidase SppA, 36K type [Ignisphaera aggregans DSM 17230]|uniref:Signal peptide peptidase SppA, 36K type n=1 Tax=Ignisphaera aggregans (strain DSM 17230 / JCM 13409 / AQ1.S1) TaxID=583356 RepID=E0STN9_IGNAA|nr:signal peptide peptidase SppA, 36K type [Ignisphaera aggregans DSM 17230]
MLIIVIAIIVIASIALTIALQLLIPSPLSIFTPPTPYIALIELHGTIDYEQPLFSGSTITPKTVSELVNKILSDPYAKAVVVVVNSPGGTMAAFEIYSILKKLSSEKIVIVYITNIAASGGYLIALPAREIIANPSATIGSVGAIATIINVHNLLQKLGINVTIVKSGELKDVGSMYRETTETDIETIKSLVDSIANEFIEKVIECRGNKIKNISEIRRAGVYPAREAKELGLIDDIGDLDYAINRARQLAGLPPTTPIKRIEPTKPSLLDIILGRVETQVTPTPRTPRSIEILLIWPPQDYALDIALRYGITTEIVAR